MTSAIIVSLIALFGIAGGYWLATSSNPKEREIGIEMEHVSEELLEEELGFEIDLPNPKK